VASDLLLEFKLQGKSISDVVSNLREALKAKGFGVLTEFNLDEIVKEKTGDTISPAVVLEVCKPSFASQALKSDISAASLMPCRIAVYPDRKGYSVSILRPTSIVGNDRPRIRELAVSAEKELKEALMTLSVVSDG